MLGNNAIKEERGNWQSPSRAAGCCKVKGTAGGTVTSSAALRPQPLQMEVAPSLHLCGTLALCSERSHKDRYRCLYLSLSIYSYCLLPNPSLSNSHSWIYSSPRVAVEEKRWLKTGHHWSLHANHRELGSCACESTGNQ